MTVCGYISSLMQSVYFLSLFALVSLFSKQINAFKAYILLLHICFPNAGASYTFYPLSKITPNHLVLPALMHPPRIKPTQQRHATNYENNLATKQTVRAGFKKTYEAMTVCH